MIAATLLALATLFGIAQSVMGIRGQNKYASDASEIAARIDELRKKIQASNSVSSKEIVQMQNWMTFLTNAAQSLDSRVTGNIMRKISTAQDQIAKAQMKINDMSNIEQNLNDIQNEFQSGAGAMETYESRSPDIMRGIENKFSEIETKIGG